MSSIPESLKKEYSFEPKLKIWQRNSSKEFRYSDGEQVEKHIAELLSGVEDKSTLSDELRKIQTNWPTTYYFSASRSNLLRPLAKKLLKDARVLELGCGMGALTRYLGEYSKEVYAVEGSVHRGKVAARRCEDLDNTRIFIDEIKSLPEEFGQFDVVTLIGVLEYSRVFGGPGMEKEILKKAASFLKPGGALILAIENKMGLKYFGAIPEDHLGRSYAGLTNGYREDGVRTWSKHELLDLLHECGFARCEQFAALPDYKLPATILTPKALATKPQDLNLSALLSGCRRPYEAFPLFNAGGAWESVVDAGLLPDLLDSLCFVARKEDNDKDLFEDNALAHHYGNNSQIQKKFAKEITIKFGETGLEVERQKMSVDDANPDSPYFQNLEAEKYYPGRLLVQDIRQTVMRPDWTMSEFFESFTPWVQGLQSAMDENWEIDGDMLDYTPFNLAHTPAGFKFFDREWISSKKLSFPFLLFRGFYHTINRIMPFAKSRIHSVEKFSQLWEEFVKYLNLPESQKTNLEYLWWQEMRFMRFVMNKAKPGLPRDFPILYM